MLNSTERHFGTVAQFDKFRHHGFIRQRGDSPADIFFRTQDMTLTDSKRLTEGSGVSFVLRPNGRTGQNRALDIRIEP